MKSPVTLRCVRWIGGSALALACLPVVQAQQAEAHDSTRRLDEVVITATRGAERIGNIASRMETVNLAGMQETTGPYLTDILKKRASVDVVQYPGGLSGIGIRGFRPEFSGTHKRVLILQDGHPAGFTSVGSATRASVARVEVLKGSASALYGSSAMGGVVNFISHENRGAVEGELALGAGSFAARSVDVRIGGALGDRLDFDLSWAERSQDDDYRLGKQSQTIGSFVQGGGVRRPYTTFANTSTFARLQYALADNWSLQGRAHGYYNNDVYAPGAESDASNNVGLRDIKGHGVDLRLRGDLVDHALYALAYSSREADSSLDVDAGRFRDGERLTRYDGLQLQDNWTLNATWSALFGVDYEVSSNATKRYAPDGSMRAPFSPDDRRVIRGAYAELSAQFLDERLVLNGGLRHDSITAEVLATNLRPDLTPAETTVDTTNPRVGLVLRPVVDGPFRVHASAGTGFVTPLANQLAGFTDEVVGIQRRITRGNANLVPEESTSYDLGLGYEADSIGLDLTWFRITNANKIESVFLSNTETLRELGYVNASTAQSEGLELSLQSDLGRLLGGRASAWLLDFSSTYFLERSQHLAAGVTPLRNVARMKINTSLSYAQGPAQVKLSARHVSGIIDQDFSGLRIFSSGSSDIFEYPDVLVFDLHMSWRFNASNQLALQIDNLEDAYYYEKNDYPSQGRSYNLTYRHSF